MDLEKETSLEKPLSTHSDIQEPVRLAIGVDLEGYSSEEQGSDIEAVESKRSEHHAVSRVVTAQDWTGHDDPENPHNWGIYKRAWHTVQPALFGFAVLVASQIQLYCSNGI
jgi:hypothetical protein